MKYLIVGAGLTGCVLAERLSSNSDNQVILIDKKRHIGGSCYDRYDENGILIHQYGPHIFNTDSLKIWNYVNQFSKFENYFHRVLGYVDGILVPIPFNLESIEKAFPKEIARTLKEKLIKKYGYNKKVQILELQEQDDPDLNFLAEFIYEKVFLHYTVKQWGKKPEEVGGKAMARIPVFISKDNRYFQNSYQGMPSHGYTRLMEEMINKKNISTLLGMDYRKIISLDENKKEILVDGNKFDGKVIFTACLDELFDYKFGILPYRSLDFVFETHDVDSYQPVATVNYPNNYRYTRITEYKKLTNQKHDKTVIMKEFPIQFEVGNEKNDPLYPIPMEENEELYRKYFEESKKYKDLIVAGRLANYKYFTMSETIENALKLYDEISNS